MQRHIDIYRHKVTMGSLNKNYNKKAIEASQSSLNDIDIQYEIPIDDPSQVALHKEMLQANTSNQRDLQLSVESIDF